MRSHFSSPAWVKQNKDGKTWTIVESFYYSSAILDKTITIPKGFQTDLASVPRFLWSIGFAPFGKYTDAAIVHDFLYTFQPCSRSLADMVLLEAMRVLGVGKFKSYTIYSAVRAFGYIYWSRDHSKDKILKNI